MRLLSGVQRNSCRVAVLCAALVLGIVVSLAARVYPETVTFTGGCTPLRPGDPPRARQVKIGRCSLAEILDDGFRYGSPGKLRERSAQWLLLYVIFVPLSVVGALWFIRRLGAVATFLGKSIAQIASSRWRQVFTALAGVSILCHVILLHPIVVGGTGHLGPVGKAFHQGALIVGIALLPLSLLNQAVLFGLNWMSRFVAVNSAPSLAFRLKSYRQFGGSYPYNGLFWELICIILLVVFWILVVGAVGEGADRLRRWHSGLD